MGLDRSVPRPLPLLSSFALLAGNGFMRSLRIICPNGHLGFAPIRVESFRLGVAARPDCIAADSGSDDVGPIPLGTDTSTSPRAWQTHDLEHMLLASRKLRVPMIIGSAGDTGADSRVDLYVQIIKDLAAKHALPRFKLGYFYSEIGREDLRRRMRAGETVAGLEGYEALNEAELDATRAEGGRSDGSAHGRNVGPPRPTGSAPVCTLRCKTSNDARSGTAV